MHAIGSDSIQILVRIGKDLILIVSVVVVVAKSFIRRLLL
jgi:hypothetical protein